MPHVRGSRAQSDFLSPPPPAEAAADSRNKGKKRRRINSLLLLRPSPPPRLSPLHLIPTPPRGPGGGTADLAAAAADSNHLCAGEAITTSHRRPVAAASATRVRIVRLVPPSVIRIDDPAHFAAVVQRLTGTTSTTSPSSSSISSPLSSGSRRRRRRRVASTYDVINSCSSIEPPVAMHSTADDPPTVIDSSLDSGITNSAVDNSVSHAAAGSSSSGAHGDGGGSTVRATSVSSPAASGNVPVVINGSVDDRIAHIVLPAGRESCSRSAAGMSPRIPTAASPDRLTGFSVDSTAGATRPDGCIGRCTDSVSTAADHHRSTATSHNGDCGEDADRMMMIRRSGALVRGDYNANYERRTGINPNNYPRAAAANAEDHSTSCCGMRSSNCSLFKDLDLPDDCYHYCRRFENDRDYPPFSYSVGGSGDGYINAAAATVVDEISPAEVIDYEKPAGHTYHQLKGLDDHRLELFSIPADLIFAEFWENYRDE